MTLFSSRHNNTSVVIYFLMFARPARQQHQCLCTKTNSYCLCVFVFFPDRKLLLFVCLSVCDGSVWQGVYQQ